MLGVTDPIDPLLRRDATRSNVIRETIDVRSLYRDNRARLVGLAAAITLDAATAEEVVQEAFEGLQRHVGEIANPLGYLQRSVVNLGITVIRRRRVAERHPTAHPPLASAPEIDEAWAAVIRLPARQRAVVVLRFWQDQTIDTIAETLGWPSGSVKSTLHRALKRLEEELS